MSDHADTTVKVRRTSIDDLTVLGHELSENRLRLAAGGLSLDGGSGSRTNGCFPTYRDGQMDHPSGDLVITLPPSASS